MLSVIYAECHIQALYAECRYAEYHYAECRYAECRGTPDASEKGNIKSRDSNVSFPTTSPSMNEHLSVS
jgi:hypothetical protein